VAAGRSRKGAPVKVMRQTWRGGQMAPTPDRYKEIQEALTAKGYSVGSPDGVWGPQWSGSLKRFQQDQKLEPSGKLTSLSLRTLGLGPRRETSESPAAAPAPANISSEPVTRELK
jgi:peptidoglycan hydrolase-like protein with peptidoglycan-binding domain